MQENSLERLRDRIDYAWNTALKFGLDPFPTHFELVPATIMYEFASYSLPGRFSHWTHGKAYHRQKLYYDLGLSKIYEMVVNTNPSYAFLMEMNDVLQNTFVVAHVFGHTDFFKNNSYFQHTSRRMIDKVSIHADRISKYEFDHGKLEVEHFLDAVLSIQEHVDHHLLLQNDRKSDEQNQKPDGERTSQYDDLWGLDREVKERRAEEEREKRRGRPVKFPEKPEKDLLLFLLRHSPILKPWQRDVIEIVRQEWLYFVPQMQTKVMNEGWACLVKDSLVLTEHGLLRYDALHAQLAQGQELAVASGVGERDRVTDRHLRRQAATVRLHTRRGLVLEGAEGHKLSCGQNEWIELKDARVGQHIPLSLGTEIWPEQLVPIRPLQATKEAGVRAVASYSQREQARSASTAGLTATISQVGSSADSQRQPAYRTAFPLVAPTHLTEDCAVFLGYLLADGRIDPATQAISYTPRGRNLLERYAQLVTALFALQPAITREAEAATDCVVFYSANVLELVQLLGVDLRVPASGRHFPEVILRSPKAVMSAFLRAYFADASRVSPAAGLALSTASDELARTVQLVLLNYGILTQRDGSGLRIEGHAAQVFQEKLGLASAYAQEQLKAYIATQDWSRQEEPSDEIVRIEYDVADVYDITVARSHQYVANGMLHHNSIWHSRIMREMGDEGIITDSETLEFAQLHSGVLSPSRTSLNPYYLGFKMFEDIERRWNEPTEEERARLGRQPGKGREKIFEVRELDNDVSFLRNYLTKDLIHDLDLYLYKKEGDEWVIAEKNWEKVRDGIVASMTNFGFPYLVVDDGDFHGNRELYLKHLYEGQELDLNYAEKTLQHVHILWGRPVHLETLFEGKRILLSYDGERNSKTSLEK